MESATQRHQRVLHRQFIVRPAAPHKSSHPDPTSSPRIPLWTANTSVRSGSHLPAKNGANDCGDTLYFSGWTTGNDAGEQVELPVFAEVIAAADANHDGKLPSRTATTVAANGNLACDRLQSGQLSE